MHIVFTPGSEKDLDYFSKREQKLILSSIRKYLSDKPAEETKRKKQLRPNPIAPWELRIGNYRVFYKIEDTDRVKILAIGFKIHNELFIQGKRIQL